MILVILRSAHTDHRTKLSRRALHRFRNSIASEIPSLLTFHNAIRTDTGKTFVCL